jgi:START domain
MTDENSAAKPRTRLKTLLRRLFIVSASLVVLYSVARLVYRFSGSNQWELAREEKGIKIYTLKQPGSDLTLVKGVTRVRTTMSAAVAWLVDGDTCRETGCRGEKNIEAKEEELQYAYMIFDLPGPFKPRDIAMRIHLHQLPKTKEIWADYVAAPEKEPPHECCHRITFMSNSFRLTPVGNGEVEMEYVMNTDWGGWIPDPMSNLRRPDFMLAHMRKLQGYVSKEKYKNVKFSYIQEP